LSSRRLAYCWRCSPAPASLRRCGGRKGRASCCSWT
jgi:hypothetical protein